MQVRFHSYQKKNFLINEILASCHRITRQVMDKLKIELFDVYNLLKFIRHKIDVSVLRLNEQNIVDVLFDLYMNNYLKDKSKSSFKRSSFHINIYKNRSYINTNSSLLTTKIIDQYETI